MSNFRFIFRRPRCNSVTNFLNRKPPTRVIRAPTLSTPQHKVLTPLSLHCKVTKSSYTGDEDFSAADVVTEELGDDGDASASVTLATLGAIVRERANVAS